MIEPWHKISSKPLGNFRVFSIRGERRVSPRTGAEHEFYVIDSVNWVNVVALTPRREMVLIEQFRHGTETVELEIPGGVMDPVDVNPVATGCRELLEETGYQGRDPQIVGQVYPNPAIMSNTCYTVYVQDCKCVKPVHFDQAEDLATVLVPLEQVAGLVAEGRIRHSLVVAALYQFELWTARQSS